MVRLASIDFMIPYYILCLKIEQEIRVFWLHPTITIKLMHLLYIRCVLWRGVVVLGIFEKCRRKYP